MDGENDEFGLSPVAEKVAMANDEQEKRLKEGVIGWNEWREQNYDVELNFFKSNLKRASLFGANLRRANLGYANLEGAILFKSNLEGANLNNANLKEASLFGANLEGANLLNSNLGEATLKSSNLEGACLTGANLKGANLSGANLEGANLCSANLKGANLDSANLKGASLSSANLKGASLFGANLEGAILFGTNLKSVGFGYANLKGADLFHANLENADLRMVKAIRLDGTCIKDAQFSHRAKDPWSILRRSYTGPKFTFLLLGLIAFALPFIGKIGFWSSVNRVQGYTQGFLETISQRAHNQGISDRIIAELGLSPEKITPLSQCLSEVCEQRSILQILLGSDKDSLFWMLPVILIAYNALRGVLTYLVAPMRDEEERSGYSPVWANRGTMGWKSPKLYHSGWWQGYQVLFYMHKVIYWLGFVAVTAFCINAWHWLFQPIYLPA